MTNAWQCRVLARTAEELLEDSFSAVPTYPCVSGWTPHLRQTQKVAKQWISKDWVPRPGQFEVVKALRQSGKVFSERGREDSDDLRQSDARLCS